ncbi:anaphase-promoting complex subunit 11 [Cajanus cajan]|uniref:anaphase-promoting complex subunit 11 n=1 Tax=Cajanus cajan TaxID=3821 RepID=UPI0010FAEE0C|nr:anaphase-promoting complex subunit 11 [Cajanus cajan]
MKGELSGEASGFDSGLGRLKLERELRIPLSHFKFWSPIRIRTNPTPHLLFAVGGNEYESQHLAWHAVASWTWDAQDETCGICRMAFDGCCPDCKLPGDDCPLIWGVCNHAFHLHCILKWVNSQTSQAHCPMCRREWQFKG